jgi:hypothetical protein
MASMNPNGRCGPSERIRGVVNVRRERIERSVRRETIRERTDRLFGGRGTNGRPEWRDPDITRAKELDAPKAR